MKTGENISIDEFLSSLDIDYQTYLDAIAYGLKDLERHKNFSEENTL